MTARLFVALDLPDAVRAALVVWRTPLLTREAGLRAVAVEALHVTLAFLGARPVTEIEPLSDAVSRCARDDATAGGLALGAPLWLPRRRPRVLAVELEDRERALARLQGRIAEALVAGGWYEPEGRRHLPHVTVARVRGREPAGARLAGTPLSAPIGAPDPFAATAVTLYRSHLGGDGSRYEPLVRIPL